MQPIPARRNGLAPESAPASASERLLLVTKLAAPPVRADLTPRPRLTDQLQQGLQRPLTLVAAPAGFGKTTLLCAWLERSHLPVAWMTLERGDNDLTRFWSYVFNALERIAPGSGAAALALLEGSQIRPLPPMETVLTVWINELTTLPQHVALVLDDYHLITAPAIHRALAYLLDHLPTQLHLVIATRADPPLPLARLRARGQLAEIRVADLRFTREEVLAFINQSLGSRLSTEQIATLEARTEGWIVGLQLAVLSMRDRTDLPLFLSTFSGSHQYIIDYLVEEVLARQPDAMRAFLLRTSILERLQESLCKAVLGESGVEASGQTLLERAAQANLFLTPIDEVRRWYRYHPLFAEALAHRLLLQQRALLPELHRRASRWYEQQELISEAIHHALAAADFQQAARLIERMAERQMNRGELATLRAWLEALPGDVVLARAELCLWRAWLLVQDGQFEQAERLLTELERTSLASSPAAGTVDTDTVGATQLDEYQNGRVAAIRAYSALRRGHALDVIRYGRQALEHLPQGHTSRSSVAWNMGIAYLWSGDFPAAAAMLTQARDMGQASGNSYIAFMATFELAQTQERQGRLTHADQSYQQALDMGELRAERLAATGPVHVGRGDLQREWNQLEMATQSLREGIAQCQQTGSTAILLVGYITLARVKQAQGDTEEARDLSKKVEQLLRTSQLPPLNVATITAWQVRLALEQAEFARADRWVEERQLRALDELSAPREVEFQTLARVLIARGRCDEALTLLERLQRLAESQGRMGNALQTLVLKAVALDRSGDEAAALRALTQALTQAQPEGYIRLFLDEGPAMARLLARIRMDRGHIPAGVAAYSARLLALLRGAPSGPSPQPVVVGPRANPPMEPLSDRELAVLRLIAAGSSNQEIAHQLVLALSTVKWYINTIYGKLQVTSRTKAIARARELDLV